MALDGVATIGLAVLSYVTFSILFFVWKCIQTAISKRQWQKASAGLYRPNPADWLGVSFRLRKNRHRRLDWFLDAYPKDTLTVAHETGVWQGTGMVHTQDPKVIEHMLKTHVDSYVKDLPGFPPIKPLRTLLGDGIFCVNHGKNVPPESWYDQRKMSSLIFTQQNFRDSFMKVFLSNGNTLIDQLAKAAANGETVDIQQQFFRYTMDSFGEIGFGVHFDTLVNGGGETEAFPAAFDAAHATLIPIFNSVIPLAFMTTFFPWPVGNLGRWLIEHYHPLYRELAKQNKILDKNCYRIINERRNDPNLADKTDLLSLFMKATQSSYAQDPKSNDKFLRDILLNLFIAGRDTTACTLSWMFYCLCKNPEVYKQLQQEIDEATQDGPLDYAKIKGMKYLHGVVYETLRLHPPVPLDPKVTAVDDTLPDGTVLKKGTFTVYFPWGMGRNPKFWPNPEKFDPTRWMEGGDVKSAFEFPVFQAGPRICLGKDMAVLESKVAAAVVLQHFEFEEVPGQPTSENYAILLTMCIKGGFKVNVKRR